MDKKFLIYTTATLLILSFSINPFAANIKGINALKLHIDSIVVDSHNDSMMLSIDETTWLPKTNIRYNTDNRIDIPKMRAGNLKVGFFAAYTSAYYGNPNKALSRTLALINALYWTEKNNSDIFSITPTYKEIENAVLERKIAAVPTLEGAYSITRNNGGELLEQYNDLGVKAIGFTWNYSNELGEGVYGAYADSKGTPSTGGLTELGREMVYRMNKLGIIVDISHLNTATFWDVINSTKAPVIASHSGVYALKTHQRNLNDNQLKAIADNGGVIGLVLFRGFVKDMDNTYIKDYVDHIDYVVNLIGIDHVAIGSDFDGGDIPLDMEDASDLYKITEELVNRGYSEKDIRKILGVNTLRVIKEVELLADNRSLAKNIEIIPSIQMGEKLSNDHSFFSATIKGSDIDTEKFRVIIDGIPYLPKYTKENSTISIELRKPLKEKFHVITFEASNLEGEVKRETIIFYIIN